MGRRTMIYERQAFWFIVTGKRMIIEEAGGTITVPLIAHPRDTGLTTLREHAIGTCEGRQAFAAEVEEGQPLPDGFREHGLWGLFNLLGDEPFRVALKASHIIDWDRQERFCSHCGGPLALKQEERAKECSACGFISFPRISPAVIVLVTRGPEILLARSPRFKDAFYSVLAGFVEPGETLEETVHREIREETGIEVTDIRYFASQPWPFPDSLMIAFTARYAGGEIKIDPAEIVEAGWFHVNALPAIPGRISIARRMIDWFVERNGEPESG
jgi:NAD+ diphosphatase